ncbi:Ni/Fe-hydrogenase cytochrome b subunit [bacterium]|nr:Ni/Fe-hydrogenase cytochrome b subunit [bacterium]MBU1936501.1 Ni/Fe-hydrogenase cytochrome b subunit [bacterium]
MIKQLKSLLTPWPIIAAVLLVTAFVVAIQRYIHGIGAVTNLTDQSAWGLWIGIDILGGVGLAAGGFVMATMVYVFRLKKFKPIVRMSILTAFLGYMIFVAGLLIELGRPWNMWHCIIYWNIHSPLFEVAWCVMLYSTVLFLEFSQVIFEKFGWTKLQNIFHKISVPLIITGALLSTLHQSTLGTLFTVMPSKMYPLWYSPILPILFFFSCIAAGLAMVIFESSLSKRFLKHETPQHLLLSVSRGLMLFLGIFAVIRFADISTRGALGLLFANAYETPFFWIETALFIFIPIALLLNKRIRSTPRGLFIASLSVVLGFLMHRVNVVTTAFAKVSGGYFPSWQEFLISTSFIAAGFIIVGLIARNFPLFEKAAPVAAETASEEEEGYVKIGWSV